jgi:hypothetical protein
MSTRQVKGEVAGLLATITEQTSQPTHSALPPITVEPCACAPRALDSLL